MVSRSESRCGISLFSPVVMCEVSYPYLEYFCYFMLLVLFSVSVQGALTMRNAAVGALLTVLVSQGRT